jgi:cytidylate kinase
MQIICVSLGTHGGGRELAQTLAEKMGYRCVSREDLIEAARLEGIQVGKLEMAMIRARGFTERLARERDHYLAFSRTYLCGEALKGNVVYHGRTGHLLLPGVTHVLRVRVVWDLEHRIRNVMATMGLERSKAVRYVQGVDEDRAKWVRSMYGAAVEEAINYDFTVNLQHVSVQNAASALVSMAQLPDFQITPASRQVLEDLYLGANARLALARHNDTHQASLKVRADAGVVTVNYTPQDTGMARYIPDVLKAVPGIRDLRITMATANLLWIQEEFRPQSDLYRKVLEVATKWNAAVELLRLCPGEELEKATGREEGSEEGGSVGEPGASALEPSVSMPGAGALETPEPTGYDGGIEADEPEMDADDGGVQPTLDDLALVGRSGGGRSVCGTRERLVEMLDRTVPYTLVVVGEVFLSKGHSARIRATRDLRSFLSERIRAPVVTAEELGSQYLFGRRDVLRAVLFLVIAAVLYGLVFTNQEAVLAFLANTGWYADAVSNTALGRVQWLPKLLVSAAVFVFIPIVAFSYGKVAGTFLKLIKME